MRVIRTLPVYILAFLLAVAMASARAGAQSPSFDCSKSHTPSAVAVCNDGQLAALDSEMAGDYRKILAALPEDQQPDFRRAHLAWFKEYSRRCNAPMTDDQRKECIRNAMSARIGQFNTLLGPPQSANSPYMAVGACFKGGAISGVAALIVAAVVDFWLTGGLSGLTAAALDHIGGTLLTGCVSGALHHWLG